MPIPITSMALAVKEALEQVQLESAPYTQYLIDSKYEWHEGVIQIPQAGPAGSPSVMVKVHEAYGTRVIKWTAERIREKPILPYWDTGNVNEVLTYKNITPASVALSLRGEKIFRVSGLYIYALKRPPSKEDRLFSGKIPPDPDPISLTAIDGSLYSITILTEL